MKMQQKTNPRHYTPREPAHKCRNASRKPLYQTEGVIEAKIVRQAWDAIHSTQGWRRGRRARVPATLFPVECFAKAFRSQGPYSEANIPWPRANRCGPTPGQFSGDHRSP